LTIRRKDFNKTQNKHIATLYYYADHINNQGWFYDNKDARKITIIMKL